MSILYRGYEKLPNRAVGWGDAFEYDLACYLHAKEKGYKDEDIYIVFPRFGYESDKWGDLGDKYYYQPTNFLPWNHYPRNKEIDKFEWEEIIDTTQQDSLYEGFPGIQKTGVYIYMYFNIYHYIYKKRPYLDIPRTNKDKSYILFQTRNNNMGSFSNARITNEDNLLYMYNNIKDKLGDKYEYWKTGEPTSIDDRFDNIVPMMYDDLDLFMEIIRNSSLVVGTHSGPPQMAFYFEDVPVIRFDMVSAGNLMDADIKPQEKSSILGFDLGLAKKYNIPYSPSFFEGNMLYRRKEIFPDEGNRIELTYSDLGDLPSKEDIQWVLESNNL